MNTVEILSHVDHTLLSRTATWQQIKKIIDEGIEYSTASVCIPPCYVARAVAYAEGRVPICTVIGFPCGYSTTAVKCHEAAHAAADGADEIDMVINLGMVKEGDYTALTDEIKVVKESCRGKVLKVIVETSELTEEEKLLVCDAVGAAGADYIKTSTGFFGSHATEEDVALFASRRIPGLLIKASGGIATLAEGERYIALGADRLGTSRLVKEASAKQ